jgi:hypothetical protein
MKLPWNLLLCCIVLGVATQWLSHVMHNYVGSIASGGSWLVASFAIYRQRVESRAEVSA